MKGITKNHYVKRIVSILILFISLVTTFPVFAESEQIGKITMTYGSNVRSLPSTDGSIIGYADEGKTYPCYEEKNGWYLIKIDTGKKGYVSGTRGTYKKTKKSTSIPSFTIRDGLYFGMPLSSANIAMMKEGYTPFYEDQYRLLYEDIVVSTYKMKMYIFDIAPIAYGFSTTMKGITMIDYLLVETASTLKQQNGTTVIKDFDTIESMLTKKYGKPTYSKREWKNESNSYLYSKEQGAYKCLYSLCSYWDIDGIRIFIHNEEFDGETCIVIEYQVLEVMEEIDDYKENSDYGTKGL